MRRLILLLFSLTCASYIALVVYSYRLNQNNSDDSLVIASLPASFEPFAEKAALIRPLYEKKKPAQAGDWLEAFPESGQSFVQYVTAMGREPLREAYSTIYIQPFGDFDETQMRIVAETEEFLGLFYGKKVELLEPRSLGEIPETASRMRDGQPQISVHWILDECLKPQRPDDAIAVIGLVTTDLWSNELNWVFGSASLHDRVGVWSLYRNGDPRVGESAYRLCLQRTLKTAAHETGHMLGIPHCAAYECGMNGSRSREESDRRPIEFCPECQAKIWWTCRVDAAERSRRLADFATRQGFATEAEFWKRQGERLSD